MRYVLLCALLACGGGSRTERVDVAPVPLPSSPQPVTSGALALPAPRIAGAYDFDVAATRPYIEASFAKLPADQQQFMQMAMAMLEKLHATLTLADDGSTTMTMQLEGEHGEDTKTGTWRRDAADVIVTNDGKDMRCTVDGPHLLCAQGKQSSMVFTRH